MKRAPVRLCHIIARFRTTCSGEGRGAEGEGKEGRGRGEEQSMESTWEGTGNGGWGDGQVTKWVRRWSGEECEV